MPRVSLETVAEIGANENTDWLALDQALDMLTEIDETAAKTVELRYFAGLKTDEIASALGLGTATISRHWRFARAWLKNALKSETGEVLE